MMSTTRSEAASPRRLRILVADDDEELRPALQKLLMRLGHFVDAVANGREAVEAVAAGSYDVMILDIEMPVMNGIEAAYRARRVTCGQPLAIIGISGHARNVYAQTEGLMDDFLLKPIGLSDLARTLDANVKARGSTTARSRPESGADAPWRGKPLAFLEPSG
jgi:CheY-like chemotaxis protein